MSKVKRIFEITQEINFLSPQKEFSLYWHSFLNSDLGKIYQCLPWNELVKHFKIKDLNRGRTSIFSPQGKLALMFLKSYTGFSDRRLIEHLNGSIHFQLFCGIFLGLDKLVDYKIVSHIRTELSKHLNIVTCQRVLSEAWKPYLDCKHVVLTDATCYETDMRYPTNVKLLWESTNWVYHQLKLTCKYLKIRMPRNKYSEQEEKYLNYSRKRKKSHKESTIRTRSLLYLLEKLIDLQKNIEDQYNEKIDFPKRYYLRMKTIHKILTQQQIMFKTRESVKNRIVSIDKSYIRPIVRGKEVKKVEFGAKVNMIQIDGINFIEHLSFDAFNEGTRLISSVRCARSLFGKITHVAGDGIYATNKNRKYATRNKITTCFKRKGKPGKYEGQRVIMSQVLRKERATRMEGSFGTEKEHYGLYRIKARTEKNEILWIFFGVHTCNAVKIAHRLAQENVQKKIA
jgi:Transposase domain (DUF772)